MRLARRLVGLLLFAIVLASCDTAQPEQVDSQTAEITISAVNSSVQMFNVWDVFEDSNQDNVPDGPSFLWCEQAIVGGNLVFVGATSVPWNFSVEVSVLRGETGASEVITDVLSLDPEANTALYDTIVILGATGTHSEVVVDDMGTIRRFQFGSGRRLSVANRAVVSATSNPVTDLDASYGWGNGLCSLGDPGEPAVDDQLQPYSVSLGKGDTVIVKARKSLLPPQEMFNDSGQLLVSVEPILSGKLFIDGVEITPDGDRQSDVTPGAGIIFSHTVR